MNVHEAANIFPLDEESIPELAEDIRKHGLLETIKVCGGKLLDGRRRLRACELAGVEPRFEEVNPPDPVAYSWSLNGPRRHMTPAQKAMAGARMREVYDRQAKERRKRKPASSVQESFPEQTGQARDQVAKVVGVSGRSVDHATRVLKQAVPEVVAAVDEGRMGVVTAALLSTEPEEVQREEAAQPKRRRTYQSVSNPPEGKAEAEAEEEEERKLKGVGVIRAHEAINCLTRIPKNDALRKRGFQVVTDWIRRNK